MCDFQAFLCEACQETIFALKNLFKAVEKHRKHLWKHYKDLVLNEIMVLLRFWYFEERDVADPLNEIRICLLL